MVRCFCACHEYPGTYGGRWCGICQHDNRRGHFPDSVRDGWEPEGGTESTLSAISHITAVWERGAQGSYEAMQQIVLIIRKWRGER